MNIFSLNLLLLFYLYQFACVIEHVNATNEPNKREQTLYEILNTTLHAALQEIKRNYHSLALLYHPDKNLLSEIDDTTKSEKFLSIQKAYEILSDKETRLQYDLSLTGIKYNLFPDSQEDSVDNSHIYQQKSFEYFAKFSNIKIKFKTEFEQSMIPPIFIDIHVNFKDTLTGTQIEKEYYHRRSCIACNGTGGLNGQVSQCYRCNSTGISVNTYNNHNNHNKFQSYSKSICIDCKGFGYIPINKCLICNGSSYIMEKSLLSFQLPINFDNNLVLVFTSDGHEMKSYVNELSKKFGDLIVKVMYSFDNNWKLNEKTGLLSYYIKESWDNMKNGYKNIIITPLDDPIAVRYIYSFIHSFIPYFNSI